MADRFSGLARPPAQTPQPSEAPAPVEYLEWDSRFFGRRIARVRGRHLNDNLLANILEWCSAQRIECLYFLAASDDPETIRLAERNAFGFVDIRTTFERSLEGLPEEPSGIRPSRPDDLPQLKRITGRGFSDSRFYSDLHFDRPSCDELYAVWIEKSCQGYADCVLVADFNGKAAGYVTCSLGPSQAGSIGLIAVDPESQGCGLGQRLLASALHYFRNNGMTSGTVVTQGRNIKSQRLYERCGFLTKSIGLWYHRWFDSPGAVPTPR
jgi:dTDP-4-amino-4,6-dideoxy-D-galactose acyltransferase